VSNIRNLTLSAALAALAAGMPVAFAQDSLDALLDEVQAVRADERKAFEQRAAEYNAAPPAQQQSMLAEAQAKRDGLSATSTTLSDQFSANEIRINEARKGLREKAATLGLTEVFGLSKQVAGDTSTLLRQSLIATQFPPAQGELSRDEFLRTYSASQATPVVPIWSIWFELQREMTASGQVARYQYVVQPGGEAVEAEVIRIRPLRQPRMANSRLPAQPDDTERLPPSAAG
jgi:biopolymer transport protein ExbB